MSRQSARRAWLIACAALVMVVLLVPVCGLAQGQTQKPSAPPPAGQPPAGQPPAGQPPAGQPPANAEMEQMMQPGPEHALIARLAGKWQAENKLWMDPAGAPMVIQGTAEWKPVLGGRYLEGSFSATMMGQPFEGLSIDGYDRWKKEYFNIWFDTMGTGMMVSRGTASPDGKTLNMKGTWFDPAVQADVPGRSISTWVDDNTLRLEMYETKGGKEMKVMETVYKRQQ